MLASINPSRIRSRSARSVLVAAAAMLGLAASTGLARTEPLSLVPGYGLRTNLSRPKRDRVDDKLNQFKADMKRVKRAARNLDQARRGAYGSTQPGGV